MTAAIAVAVPVGATVAVAPFCTARGVLPDTAITTDPPVCATCTSRYQRQSAAPVRR